MMRFTLPCSSEARPPELGRFIQQDPIRDDINWYTYAANNPLVFIDPEGNAPRRTSDEMILDATANLQRCVEDAVAELGRCLSEAGMLDYAAGAAGGALLVDAAWTHVVKLHPYAKIAAGIYGAARGIGVWVERRSCLKANQAQVESCYIAAAFARKRAGDTVPESWKGWMSPETKEMMRKHRQL